MRPRKSSSSSTRSPQRVGRKPPARGLGWRLRRAWWRCSGGRSGWRAQSAEAVPSPLPCLYSHQAALRWRRMHEGTDEPQDSYARASHMNPFGETILLVDDDLDFQEIVM